MKANKSQAINEQALADAWGKVIKKFKSGTFIKSLDDKAMDRDRTYAKLVLIVQTLKKIGAISEYKECDISLPNGFFGRSFVLTTHLLNHSIYILNGGREVIVTEGVMMDASPLDRNLACLAFGMHSPLKVQFGPNVLEADEVFADPCEWTIWTTIGKAVIDIIDQILAAQAAEAPILD